MTSNVASDDGVVAEILKLEDEWRRACRARDFVALKSLLGADLTFTHGTGFTHPDRDHFLDNLARAPRWSLEPQERVVRVYGDVAVITGDQILHIEGLDPIRCALCQVWVKRSPSWQQILVQNTAKRRVDTGA